MEIACETRVAARRDGSSHRGPGRRPAGPPPVSADHGGGHGAGEFLLAEQHLVGPEATQIGDGVLRVGARDDAHRRVGRLRRLDQVPAAKASGMAMMIQRACFRSSPSTNSRSPHSGLHS